MIFSNMKNRAKGDNFTAFDRYNLRSDEDDMHFDGYSNFSISNKHLRQKN